MPEGTFFCSRFPLAPIAFLALSPVPLYSIVVLLQGHVFCFTCVYEWTKTKIICPTCRVGLKKITKTLTAEDIAKEEARLEVRSHRLQFYMYLLDCATHFEAFIACMAGGSSWLRLLLFGC